jgi:hypothetical protein
VDANLVALVGASAYLKVVRCLIAQGLLVPAPEDSFFLL